MRLGPATTDRGDAIPPRVGSRGREATAGRASEPRRDAEAALRPTEVENEDDEGSAAALRLSRKFPNYSM
jgi:hypothetical protein